VWFLRQTNKQTDRQTSTPVFWDGRIFTRRTIFHERRIPSVTFTLGLHTANFTSAVAGRFVGFLASGGAKFPKMGNSLPRTTTNHCAKFDTAGFIIGGEIRNRINTHIHKQSVSDISTRCLSACVDNKQTCRQKTHRRADHNALHSYTSPPKSTHRVRRSFRCQRRVQAAPSRTSGRCCQYPR